MMIELLTQVARGLFLISLKSTVVISVILSVQFLLHKKLSVRLIYALWFLLIAKLLIPYELPSPLSIFNVLYINKSQTLTIPHLRNWNS